jgi:hypothetical protein
LFPLFATGVVYTGGKFAIGVFDTGGNLPPVLIQVANLQKWWQLRKNWKRS